MRPTDSTVFQSTRWSGAERGRLAYLCPRLPLGGEGPVGRRTDTTSPQPPRGGSLSVSDDGLTEESRGEKVGVLRRPPVGSGRPSLMRRSSR